MSLYDNMKFPAYQFVEYPKMVVNPETGHRVKVLSAEEEFRVLNGTPVVREADERSRLIQEATNKGVQVDRSWPLERIAEEIEEHDAAVTMARASLKARKEAREAAARDALVAPVKDRPKAAAKTEAKAEEPPAEDDADKKRLIRLADAKGVKIDKRKSLEAIAEAIREAGFDDAEAA